MKSPVTPEPIIIRERPPPRPAPIPQKIITIPGKVIIPKRSIIIEKIESKPNKPPMIIIERWLPYDSQKRRVVYQKISENNSDSNKSSDSVTSQKLNTGININLIKIIKTL